MDVFAELESLQSAILRRETAAAKDYYAELCRRHGDQAKRIASVQLSDYSDRLFDAYCKALKASHRGNAAAIYFEYDLDNNWNANFFVCPDYAPLSVGDDDWACGYTSIIRTSGIYEFGKIYNKLERFCTTSASTAATLYMIARTTNALSEVVDRKPQDKFAVCLGFHDQNPIHRLRNGG